MNKFWFLYCTWSKGTPCVFECSKWPRITPTMRCLRHKLPLELSDGR